MLYWPRPQGLEVSLARVSLRPGRSASLPPVTTRRLVCAVVGALLAALALAMLPRAVSSLGDPGRFSVRPATRAEAPVPSRAADTIVAEPDHAAPVAGIVLRWALTLSAWAALAAVGLGLITASLLACWPAAPWQAFGTAEHVPDPPAH